MAPVARLLLLHQLAAPPLSYPSPTPDILTGPAYAQRHAPPTVLDPRRGAVATENARCSRIGASTILAGGNAADAAVAAVLCVGVVGMYHAGIGGGGFMLVRTPNSEGGASFEHIDFREAAPAAASRHMFDGLPAGRSVDGGLAAGVPGELRGLALLHARRGRLPWRDLVMPSVRLAREGWQVGPDLQRYMDFAATRSTFLTDDPEWARDFAPKGHLLRAGEIIRRPRYADTLETIAREGAGAFYEGPIAEATLRALTKTGGIMTAADLREYEPETRLPLEIRYRGHRIVSCGTPASGSVVLATLGIVEGYEDFGWPEAQNLSTHRLDEAMRLAYGLRTRLGDPSFVKGMRDYEGYMVNRTTHVELRHRITDDRTHDVSYYNPELLAVPETHGTSQISVIDGNGMAISLTTTVNLIFGNRVIVPETGVILNNEMDDFAIHNKSNSFGYVASPSNFIRAGKRPLSSITPVIVERPDGQPYFVVGAAGGSKIPTGTILALRNVLDLNMSLPDALAAARFHDQLMPNQVVFEDAADGGTVAFMVGLGHNTTRAAAMGNIVHAVLRLANGTFEAKGDPRQLDAAGYAV